MSSKPSSLPNSPVAESKKNVDFWDSLDELEKEGYKELFSVEMTSRNTVLMNETFSLENVPEHVEPKKNRWKRRKAPPVMKKDPVGCGVCAKVATMKLDVCCYFCKAALA